MIPIVQHSDLVPFVASAAVILEDSLSKGNVAYGDAKFWLTTQIANHLQLDSPQVKIVDSGTAGLIASLLHLQLVSTANKTKTRVLVPRVSYAATRTAILHAGLEPVYIDVDATGAIDFDALEAAGTTGVLAVMPVVLWGHALDWDRLRDWSAKHQMPVVLDAAQAWGTSIPAWVDYTVYSLSANKPWPTFNTLGVVVTREPETAVFNRVLSHAAGHNFAGTRGYAAEDACAQAIATWEAAHNWAGRRRTFSYRILGSLGDMHVVAPATAGRSTNWHKLVLRITSQQALDIAMQDVECKQAYTYYLDNCNIGPSFYQVPNRGTLTDAEQEHIAQTLLDVLG